VRCWCGGPAEPRDGDLVCLDSQFHDPTDSAPTGPVSRLYVSGPMSGIPDCNYPAFEAAATELQLARYIVVNPAANAIGASYREIIKEDLRDLMTCDGIATLEGWWGSKGATLEVHVAGVLQMPVRSVEEWVQLALDRNDTRPCAECGNDMAAQGSFLCTECLENLRPQSRKTR